MSFSVTTLLTVTRTNLCQKKQVQDNHTCIDAVVDEQHGLSELIFGHSRILVY